MARRLADAAGARHAAGLANNDTACPAQASISRAGEAEISAHDRPLRGFAPGRSTPSPQERGCPQDPVARPANQGRRRPSAPPAPGSANQGRPKRSCWAAIGEAPPLLAKLKPRRAGPQSPGWLRVQTSAQVPAVAAAVQRAVDQPLAPGQARATQREKRRKKTIPLAQGLRAGQPRIGQAAQPLGPMGWLPSPQLRQQPMPPWPRRPLHPCFRPGQSLRPPTNQPPTPRRRPRPDVSNGGAKGGATVASTSLAPIVQSRTFN